MENTNELISFRGKLLRDMTREELIEAIAAQARYVEQMHKDHQADTEWVFSLLRPRRRSFWEWFRGQV